MVIFAVIDAVVVALLVLLLLYGAALFVETESKLFRPIPGVGPAIADWLGGAATFLRRHALQIAIGSLGPIGALIAWLWKSHSHTNAHAQSAVQAVRNKLWWIIHVDIPNHTAHAIAVAEQYANRVAHNLAGVEAQILRTVAAEVATSKADAAQWVRQLNHATQQARADLHAQIDAQIAHTATTLAHQLAAQGNRATAELRAVEQWASASLGDLSRQATGQAQAAIAYAKTIGSDAIHYADNVGTTIYHETIGAIDTQVSHVAQSVWAGIPGIANSAAQQLQTINPEAANQLMGIPAAAPPTVAGLMGAMLAISKTTLTAVDTCVLPNCPEKNKLGKEAHTLSSLLGVGAFLAFFVAAVTEPTATARDTDDVVEAIVTPIVDSVKSLITT